MENKTPKVEEIQQRFKAYENFYQQLHKDQKETDDYYELTFDAKVPENYPARVPPTARDWVDVGVRHYTLDNPRAIVYPRNDSEAARNEAAIKEMFYNFWLRKEILKIKRGAKKLLKRGEAFVKVIMDDAYLGRDDEQRLFHFPLSLLFTDPINTFPSPAHRGLVPVDVFEQFNITVAEAEELCETNKWRWKTDKSATDLVEWRSYLSDNWRCFTLDDEPVLTPEVQPNILGFCNYVHIDAGFGDDNYEGKPEYLYRSILWPKRDMLKLDVRTLSALDAVNARFAWPQKTVILGDVGAKNELEQIYPGGNIPTDPDKWLYQIKDRVMIDTIRGEDLPAGLLQEYALIQNLARVPQVLTGVNPTGVYSGEHGQTLVAEAKPIYKDPFKNMEDGLGVTMGMGARIIEQVYKYPVQIKNFASEEKREYKQIKPSDIKGHYDCEVQLLAEPPEATDMRKALGKGLRQGGSISHITELRQYQDMSQKEAEDEIAQMAAEMALQEPAVRLVVAKSAMDRLGMHKELEQLEMAEKQAGMVKTIPPVPQGEGISREMIKTRGRETPGLESVPSPKEAEVART